MAQELRQSLSMRAVWFVAAAAVSACAQGPTAGQIPTNGLRLDTAILAQLSPAPLSNDWAARLQATPEGRGLFEYAIVCAVEAGDEVDGAPGYYGLAPEWAHEPCDQGCRRWVSACILAHANAFGVPVPISVRGDHPGLASIDPAFSHQEAAFYGDLFTGTAQTLEMFACAGRGLTGGRTAQEQDYYLRGRICGVSHLCGLVNAGFCGEIVDLPVATDLPGVSACEVDAGEGGAYADCHEGAYTELPPRTSPVVREAVTVYLGP